MRLRELRHRLTPAWLRHRCPPPAAQHFVSPAGHPALLHAAAGDAAAGAIGPQLAAVCRCARAAEESADDVHANRRVRRRGRRRSARTHRDGTSLRGVLVEPQPAAFARLQQTYRDQPQVTLLQAAIAEQEGTARIVLPTRRRRRWRRRSIASICGDTESPTHEIVAQQVACHTVESALAAAKLDRVDLIQIDAEGYDWPIIRSIDFSAIAASDSAVRISQSCSTAMPTPASHFWHSHGYRFFIEPRDIIAVALDGRPFSCRDIRIRAACFGPSP